MNLVKTFNQLHRKYGPQGWWPTYHSRHAPCPLPAGRQVLAGRYWQAEARIQQKPYHDPLFEICAGAILTQNTAWLNVEKAIKCLLQANLMSPQAISACAATKLQKCVRSSGYYKQKTKKLKIFSRWLIKKYQGDLREFFKKPLTLAREELLSLWGIGPETADSILLYAGQKPIFVIDTYTKRLCRQYNMEFKTYDEYQKFFETRLRAGIRGWTKVKFYNEYHALIVKWGKES